MGVKHLRLAIDCMVIIALLYVTADCTVENKLIEVSMHNDCICPGIVQYECTVIGIEGFTVWMGDFFHCTNGNQAMELKHSKFRSEGEASTVRICNNGNITGRIIRSNNGSFTSQLNIALTSDIAGKSIECAYDNGILHKIGSLNLTTGFIADLQPKNMNMTPTCPPPDIHFNWDGIVPNCSATYNIYSSNCGSCPTNMTHRTTATCTDVPNDGRMCEFSVQSAICSGEWQHFRIMTPNCPGGKLRIVYLTVILSVTMLLFLLAVLIPLSLHTFKKKSHTSLCSSRKTLHRNAQHKEQENEDHSRRSQVEDDTKAIKIFDNRLHGTYGVVELDFIHSEQETGGKSQDDDNMEAIKIFDNRLNETNNSVELDIQNKQVQGYAPGGLIQNKLTLNNLMIRLQGRVSSRWCQFGLALGVPNGVLEQLKDYLDEDALVEILDYWLKHHPFRQPTWQDVATALKKAGFNDK